MDNIFLIGYCSEGTDRDRSCSGDSAGLRGFRGARRMTQQSTQDQELSWIPETTGPIIVHGAGQTEGKNGNQQEEVSDQPNTQKEGYLSIPKAIVTSSSADTITGALKWRLKLLFLDFNPFLIIHQIIIS